MEGVYDADVSERQFNAKAQRRRGRSEEDQEKRQDMENDQDSNPVDLEMYELGMQLLERGRDREALEMFKKSWEHRPHATTAYRIGVVLRKQSDFANAIVWLEKAHQLNPLHSQISTEYAIALAEGDDKERAKQILMDVLSRTSTYRPASDALNRILDEKRYS